MNKIIAFIRPLAFQPLKIEDGKSRIKFQKRNFFLCFSDALRLIFEYNGINKKNDFILVPNFYCPSTLKFIREYGQLVFYKIEDDFSVNKESYFQKIIKYKPRVIINYSFLGNFLKEDDRNYLSSLCSDSTIIIDDCAHRIMEQSIIRPINGNHFYIDSIRKHSPLSGCHLVNNNFFYPANLAEKTNIYKLKVLLLHNIIGALKFFAYILNSKKLYVLSEVIFLRLDSIIGGYKKATLGNTVSFLLYGFIDTEKVKKHNKSLALYFNNKFSKLKNPDIKILNKNIMDYSELNYCPLFVNIKIQKSLIDFLNKNNIFSEVLWDAEEISYPEIDKSLYQSFIIFPLSFLIREKEIDIVYEKIEEFILNKKYELEKNGNSNK